MVAQLVQAEEEEEEEVGGWPVHLRRRICYLSKRSRISWNSFGIHRTRALPVSLLSVHVQIPAPEVELTQMQNYTSQSW